MIVAWKHKCLVSLLRGCMSVPHVTVQPCTLQKVNIIEIKVQHSTCSYMDFELMTTPHLQKSQVRCTDSLAAMMASTDDSNSLNHRETQFTRGRLNMT